MQIENILMLILKTIINQLRFQQPLTFKVKGFDLSLITNFIFTIFMNAYKKMLMCIYLYIIRYKIK